MTLEEIRGSNVSKNDRFPVGMRVLAVDDDRVCLKLLDDLLRKCQYHVTTTSKAIKALKMLRENRNRFDLVISDVHMPDIDGFKLLELVGLEMDLPVIIAIGPEISGNGPNNVKLLDTLPHMWPIFNMEIQTCTCEGKQNTSGELMEAERPKSVNFDKPKLLYNVRSSLVLKASDIRKWTEQYISQAIKQGITHGACDYLVKPVRIEVLKNIWQHVVRRKKFESKSSCLDKDHQENRGGGKGDSPTDNAKGKLHRKREDDEEDEENEDPITQKKPRVVWAGELQMKFVAAVQKLEQLGEKVIAKRILDLMNVKGITRENVASHLQKYRIMLRRIQSMEDQPTNTVVELGGTDFSSMPMTSVHGLGDFRTSSRSERISNSGLSISQTGGILGSVSSLARISLHNLSSSALIQHNHAQNLSDPISNLGKPYSVISQANHKDGLFQRNPVLLNIDQFHQSKCVSGIHEFNSAGVPSTFSGNIVPVSGLSHSLTCGSRNPLFVQGIPQQTHYGGLFGNQSTFKVTSLNSEPLNAGISGPTFLDSGKCSQNWRNTIQLSKFSPNPLSSSEQVKIDVPPPHSMRNANSTSGLEIQRNAVDFSQDSELAIDQCLGEHQQDTQHPNRIMVPSNTDMDPLSQVLDQNHGVCNRKSDASLVSQSSSSFSDILLLSDIQKSAMDSQMRSSEDYRLEQTKLQGSFAHEGYDDSLDDLMDAIMKPVQDGSGIVDGEFEFEFDASSFKSCL